MFILKFIRCIVIVCQVITSLGPAKPQRIVNNNCSHMMTAGLENSVSPNCGISPISPAPHKIILETSFTSQNSNMRPSDLPSLHWEFNKLVTKKDNSLHPPDGWYHFAPLATPESFSEVSSISSRANSVILVRRNIPRSPSLGLKDSYSVRFDDTIECCSPVPSEISTQIHTKVLKENSHGEINRGSLLARIFGLGKSKNVDCENADDTDPLRNENEQNEAIINDVQTKVEESVTSSESSPLLSSLHLLTDQRIVELLGQRNNTSKDNDSISAGSFQSINSVPEIPRTVSSDSATVNAEVHTVTERTPEIIPIRSGSSLGGESLLEDIEKSLNMSLSRTGSSARLTSLSRTGSTCRLTEVEIDIGETNDNLVNSEIIRDSEMYNDSSNSSIRRDSESGANPNYMYPILHVAHGESSV